MYLFNIPLSYILSSDEASELDDLIDQEVTRVMYDKPRISFPYPYVTKLREIQRKLNLLDSVFRAAEELPWEEYLKQQIGKLDPRVLQMPKPEVIKVTEGRPPLPTDENGSFSVGKSLC